MTVYNTRDFPEYRSCSNCWNCDCVIDDSGNPFAVCKAGHDADDPSCAKECPSYVGFNW